jgi:predicted PurR-regulated permease PerM
MSKSRIASAVVVLALGFMLGLAVNTLFASISRQVSAITETQPSSTQDTRRLWEYRVVEHYHSGINSMAAQRATRLETELNRLGQQGFEVYEMKELSGQLLVLLRRPGR